MDEADGITIGVAAGTPQRLLLNRSNRHGLIAGATGTGKTVTLQGLVEGFSAAGVPVFAADVKGGSSMRCAPSRPRTTRRSRRWPRPSGRAPASTSPRR